ncbi:hypothetical protein ACIQCF_25835 [Streptomyces sp. NPDC088353]|uniref:hypothetical protein n=1 Tax=Streptomyces sp. NPDC088353 TaxID=3365855 RepID=UPI00380B69D1
MSNTTPGNRLYGMMQVLLTHYAHKEVPDPAEDRGVVDQQDALDAVLSLAAFLDANAQAGRISVNDAEHMASMLMVIRECIRPLPVGLVESSGGEADGVTPDLQEMVNALRTARDETGMRG